MHQIFYFPLKYIFPFFLPPLTKMETAQPLSHAGKIFFYFFYVTHYSAINLIRTSRMEIWTSSKYIDKLRYWERERGKYFAWTVYKPTALLEATAAPWIQLNWKRAGFFDNSVSNQISHLIPVSTTFKDMFYFYMGCLASAVTLIRVRGDRLQHYSVPFILASQN